jgi:hypothetical protein
VDFVAGCGTDFVCVDVGTEAAIVVLGAGAPISVFEATTFASADLATPDDLATLDARASTFDAALFAAALFDVALFDAVPFDGLSTFDGATFDASLFDGASLCGARSRCVFCVGAVDFFSERPLPSSTAPAPASARSTSSTTTMRPIGRLGGTTNEREASVADTGGRCDVGSGSPSRGVAANESEPDGRVGMFSEPGGGVCIGVAARWKLFRGGIDAGLFDGGIDPGGA